MILWVVLVNWAPGLTGITHVAEIHQECNWGGNIQDGLTHMADDLPRVADTAGAGWDSFQQGSPLLTWYSRVSR